MKKAFIFDLDGTLTNSIYDIGDSVNYLLTQRGLPLHSYDEYQTYMGMGINVTLSKAMPGYDDLPEEEKAALRKAYTAHNEEHCLDKTRPYEGIPDALKALEERGMVMGIFSNKPQPLVTKIATFLFKDFTFAFMLGDVEGAPMKPDPARMLAELEKLGISAADSVFVGDGKPDVVTAKRAGMFACGVSWGFKGPEEVEGADIIVSHPREILDIT
ncbi:MAG: HAD family hydrolase [Treponema sp.]|nr:HAD family hydrolase [Treponema sp.]